MRIVVAIEQDRESTEACSLAADLTRAVDGTMVIARIVPSSAVSRDSVVERQLETLRAGFAEHAIDVRTTVLYGPADEALGDYASTHHIDLVVLHNEDKHDALLLHCLSCPVMVLRGDSEGLRRALAGQHRLRVFVAVDRSEASDAPIAWLRRLRSRVPCDITLLYAYWPATEHDRLGVPLPEDVLTADPHVLATLERELEHRVGTLMGQGNLVIRCRPSIAMVDDVVNDIARRSGADIIVVGSHHRRGWDRFCHPSVSEALVSRASVPVVCVQNELFTTDAHPPIRKVIAATDLTPAGNHAIDAAVDLIGDNVATLGVIHVRSAMTPALSDSDLADKLRSLVPAACSGVTTHAFVLERGPVATAILQKAAQWNADAICLGARAPERMLHHSVASEVVKRAECPVVVARGRPN